MCDVTPVLEKFFDKFIKEVSLRYGIPKREINNLLRSSKKEVKDIPPLNELCSLSRPELAALCKQNKLLATGTKEALICRLAKINSDKYKTEVKKVLPKFQKKSDVLSVVKKYVPIINVRRNKWGNYEHIETSLVFNQEHSVYAKQNKDGTIDNLTPEDIEKCKQFKFDWVLPENLNWNKKSLDDVKIEELDNDIFESSDESDDDTDDEKD
jgi:hypothetical protein